MSKKKHRRKGEQGGYDNQQNKSNINQNNPFGINPAQIMSLLGGNMDMGQIGNVLSSMSKEGFDLSNLNLGPLQGFMQGNQGNNRNQGGFDLGALQNMMSGLGLGGGMDLNNIDMNNLKNMMGSNNSYNDNKDELFNEEEVDENIQLLIAIKSIVDPKRANFLDRVIEAYREGTFK
ncbi:hypothetical protein JCM1393_18990 [Clostridium carnis]